MKRCGLYTRVSTDDQVKVKNGSLDTQMDLLENWVRNQDQDSAEDWRVVARYREEGQSGRDTHRPEYRRLLTDIEAGQIDVVVCTRVDRITRSLLDFYALAEMRRDYGVEIVSLGDDLNDASASGRAMGKMRLVFAELESDQTSERIRETAAWRAQKGLSSGGQILGYDLDPAHPGVRVPNEVERDLVQLIFQTYLEGNGLRRTAEILNQRGYRTKAYVSRRQKVHAEEEFSDSTIRYILTNPYYIGKIRFKDHIYDGLHEPIVLVELFQRAQRLLASNQGKRGRPQKRRLPLLDGLVRCGHCGAYMTHTFTRNAQGKTYSYYACTRQGHQGRQACPMKPAPAEALEQVIADHLAQLSHQDRTVEHLVHDALSGADDRLRTLQQRRSHLAAQRKQVEDQIDALLDSVAGRRTELKSVRRKIRQLEERDEQLEQELRALDLEIGAHKAQAASAQAQSASPVTFADLYREATPEEQRQLLHLHVNQLVWSPEEIQLDVLDLCLVEAAAPHGGIPLTKEPIP